MKQLVDFALEREQDIYDVTVSTTTQKDFFLALYAYVDQFENNELLKAVALVIFNEKKVDMTHLTELRERVMEEVKPVYSKIKEYITANSITNKAVLEELKRYESYMAGTLQTSSPPPAACYGWLCYALMCLVNDKTKNNIPFASQFGFISEEGQIQKWTFSPAYDEWVEQKEYWKRLELTKTWFSWSKLVTFYLVYRDYEKMKREHVQKGDMLSVLNLHLAYGDINIILEEESRTGKLPVEFKHDEYKMHLQRVHGFVKNALLETANLEIKHQWNFEAESGNITISGKTIKFEPDSFRAQLLGVFSQNEENRFKTWEWDELFEKIENINSEAPTNAKNKIYDACAGISNRLAKELGIQDFLVYDTRTVHINPKYSWV